MAAVKTFERLQKVELKAVKGNEELRFRWTFESKSQNQIVQFDLPSGHAMALLSALKKLQAQHGWKMPSYARPSRRPKLTVVRPSDD